MAAPLPAVAVFWSCGTTKLCSCTVASESAEQIAKKRLPKELPSAAVRQPVATSPSPVPATVPESSTGPDA